VLIGQEALFPPSFTIDNWFEHAYYQVDWETDGHHFIYIPLDLHENRNPMAHHCMLKEAHTISYIQQASHKWIERNEKETTYAQATKSLRVVLIDIQHGPEVPKRFKVAHEPLVKAMSNFKNMESHGEPIKPILHQLITWTLPKEGITFLELFGGIGIGLKTLLHLGMVVWKYFYIDIDPIIRQVAASRMMELIARFPQQFATTAWKANFTFLPFDIQLILKKHMELLGPMDLTILGWECQGFSMTRFGEGLSDTKSGLFTDMVQLITWVQSIYLTLGYVIENTPFQLDQREKVQEHYMLVKHYLGEPFLFNAAQCGSYVHRLCNWWINLAPFLVLQLALKYTIKDPNL
jgi:hypothetical protein